MIDTILKSAGFVPGKTYKAVRFLKPPKETYCVYLDSGDYRGSDDCIMLKEHDVDIEMYSTAPDPDAEDRIESAFCKIGMPFTKGDRTWIQSEGLYMVPFTFSYIEKFRR